MPGFQQTLWEPSDILIRATAQRNIVQKLREWWLLCWGSLHTPDVNLCDLFRNLTRMKPSWEQLCGSHRNMRKWQKHHLEYRGVRFCLPMKTLFWHCKVTLTVYWCIPDVENPIAKGDLWIDLPIRQAQMYRNVHVYTVCCGYTSSNRVCRQSTCMKTKPQNKTIKTRAPASRRESVEGRQCLGFDAVWCLIHIGPFSLVDDREMKTETEKDRQHESIIRQQWI